MVKSGRVAAPLLAITFLISTNAFAAARFAQSEVASQASQVPAAPSPEPQQTAQQAAQQGAPDQRNPADPLPRPTIHIPRVSRPPKLEDFLNNTPREAETKITEFRQREPHDGDPIGRPTTGYLSFDDKNLYVVMECKDERGEIRAHMSKREDIFSDDIVGVMLDTFHDHRRAYEFFVNPLGIQADGTIVEGQNDDFSFDTLWHSEGRLTEDGYIVLLAIPFKSLRFRGDHEQVWGIALMRAFARNNEQAFWPYITRKLQGFTPQMANLQGLEGVASGRNIQIIPYGSFTRARFLDQGAAEFKTQRDPRAGVDTKIVIHDALTLDITFNPDFSQVESDEPQVTINQRFEVFFPEKRPFFLENSSYFQTPETLFFSRRVADPQIGLRLSGKMGRWGIGALVIDDRAPGKVVPNGDPLSDKRAGIGVVRLLRDVGKESTIAVMATSRDFGASSNRLFSFDARIKLSPTWVFQGQAITSRARELDGERESGSDYSLGILHDDRNLSYNFFYTDRSPGFRSQLGFVPRVDIREVDQFISYRWRPKKGVVQAYGPNLFLSMDWDHEGNLADWRINLPFAIDFSSNTHIFVRRTEFYERFQGIGFREHTNDYIFSSDWLKWLGMSAQINQGVGVNFFPGNGLAPFSVNTLNGQAGLSIKPTHQLRIEETYIYDKLGTRSDIVVPGVPSKAAIFNNHIFRSKVNYQFSRALSLRAIVDYNAVLPNEGLVELERTKRLTGDVLLTYLLNPGTAFYIGYTDRFENLLLDPRLPARLRRTISPFNGVGGQFFVKMSYLFRF